MPFGCVAAGDDVAAKATRQGEAGCGATWTCWVTEAWLAHCDIEPPPRMSNMATHLDALAEPEGGVFSIERVSRGEATPGLSVHPRYRTFALLIAAAGNSTSSKEQARQRLMHGLRDAAERLLQWHGCTAYGAGEHGLRPWRSNGENQRGWSKDGLLPTQVQNRLESVGGDAAQGRIAYGGFGPCSQNLSEVSVNAIMNARASGKREALQRLMDAANLFWTPFDQPDGW
ncbi:MAG: hypothetical protein ACPGUV_05290 [Polyangiales bacterium]